MNAREAAFKVVHEVLYKEGYSNIALEQILENDSFNHQDAGFITEIVLGTLRNKILLESIITEYSNIKINKISPSAMSALLTGAYQILFMDRTPDSAACNESVKIASKFAGQKTRGFVNAVLRSVSRGKNSTETILSKYKGAEGISIRYSCNYETVNKLIKQYKEQKTIELLENMNQPAKTCIRFNNSDDNVLNEKILEAEGIGFTKGLLAKSAYYPDLKSSVASLDLYKNGVISIQDEGAQAMGEFVSPEPGFKVLDACASPGGKTIHMSCLMKKTGEITACDIHSQRVANMKSNFERAGCNNIESLKLDMSVYHEEFKDKFDIVLLDVPCSGLGTAQRRPEIKLFYKEDASLYDLQWNIFKSCAEYVKPGGHLIYGTCTLFEEENQTVVKRLLNFKDNFFMTEEKTIIPDGTSGGFYMAKLERRT